jgi:hypothetical protein
MKAGGLIRFAQSDIGEKVEVFAIIEGGWTHSLCSE